MWAFVVAAVFALVGYPLVADAETGDPKYKDFGNLQQ